MPNMHRISIRTVIIAMTLLVTMLTMLLYNTVYGNLTVEAFTQLDLTIVTQNVEQAKEQLDTLITDADKLLNYVTQSVLLRSDFTPARFNSYVEPLVQTEEGISSVALYSNTGALLAANTAENKEHTPTEFSVSEESWFQDALTHSDVSYSAAHLDHSYAGQNTWIVTLAQKVTYMESSGTPNAGVLAVHIRLKAIEDICNAYSGSARGSLILTDREGMTIYSPRRLTEALPTLSDVYRSAGTRTEEQQMLQISQPLENEQWILVGLTREGELGQTSRTMKQKGLTVLSLSMLLAFLLALCISALVCKPFRYMERAMHRIDSGVSGLRLQSRGYKEFVSLIGTYNGMIDRIEELIAESESKQEQLRSMEIAALEEQINPHFLYNALDSITWLIETGNGKDAVGMIGALARLMRLSINRGGNFHAVEREVEHIHNYLIIQKTRYGQRFASHIHVEKEAEPLLCPRLILQPIVENAIKHGIAENEDCQVVVRVFIENDKLVITVWDDGMGLPPDKLRDVQAALRETRAPDPEQISGLALKSINRRIRLLCGEEYGITIESETEEWTCVRFELPCQCS